MQVPKTPGFFASDSDTKPLLQTQRLQRAPIKLMLSLIGACNLDCFHCSGPQKDLQTPSLELLEWILTEIVPNIRAIRLGGNDNTEQLLSPLLPYFLDRMAQLPNIQHFDMVTNLSLMNDALAQSLVTLLTRIEVSLEGVDHNYERIRGSSWQRFAKNFAQLERARAQHPTRTQMTLLVCSMLSCLEDALLVKRFQDMGVDRIVLREFNPHMQPGHQENKLSNDPERVYRFIQEFKEQCEKYGMVYQINYEKNFAPRPLNFAEPQTGGNIITEAERPTCHQPWEIISISHRGELSACCRYPFWQALDITSKPVSEIWNSDKFQELRSTVNSNEMHLPCQKCEIKS